MSGVVYYITDQYFHPVTGAKSSHIYTLDITNGTLGPAIQVGGPGFVVYAMVFDPVPFLGDRNLYGISSPDSVVANALIVIIPADGAVGINAVLNGAQVPIVIGVSDMTIAAGQLYIYLADDQGLYALDKLTAKLSFIVTIGPPLTITTLPAGPPAGGPGGGLSTNASGNLNATSDQNGPLIQINIVDSTVTTALPVGNTVDVQNTALLLSPTGVIIEGVTYTVLSSTTTSLTLSPAPPITLPIGSRVLRNDAVTVLGIMTAPGDQGPISAMTGLEQSLDTILVLRVAPGLSPGPTFNVLATVLQDGSSSQIATVDGIVNPSALAFTTPLLCVHEDSLVDVLVPEHLENLQPSGQRVLQPTPLPNYFQRRIAAVSPGDLVRGANGKPVRVLAVVPCDTHQHDRHDNHNRHDIVNVNGVRETARMVSPQCIVFTPGSLGKDLPTTSFAVDPGHPICLPTAFAEQGPCAWQPAISFYRSENPVDEVGMLDSSNGPLMHLTTWDKVSIFIPSAHQSLRYDLVLDPVSCGGFIANGVCVRGRKSVNKPGYLHQISS